jgi:hypothetical protein
VTTLAEVRVMALDLPEAEERDHHGMDSFRVRGKIFATVPDPTHLRVMAGEEEIRAAVAEHPGVCEPFTWGKRLACVVVDLGPAPRRLVRELLEEAWANKAPRALAQRGPRSPGSATPAKHQPTG